MSQFPITDTELAGIRKDANQQLFKDEGIVTRVTNEGTLNTTTGLIENDARTEIYSGPCSCYPIESRRDRFDEFGQGLVFTRQYRVVLPWDATGIQIRDIFYVTESNDPDLVDREMEVRDVFVSTLLGYRRLTVQDTRE